MALTSIKSAIYFIQDPAISDEALLIGVHNSPSEAFTAVKSHAANQISRNWEWGATSETTTRTTFEVLDQNDTIKLKYELHSVIDDGSGTYQKAQDLAATDGFETIPTPNPDVEEKLPTAIGGDASSLLPAGRGDYPTPAPDAMKADEPLEAPGTPEAAKTHNHQDEPVTPEEQTPSNYGLYLSFGNDVAKKESHLLNFFTSLGEAESDMKMFAGGQLGALNKDKRVADCTFYGKAIEIRNHSNASILRYEIRDGRLLDGQFITDEDWLSGKRVGEKISTSGPGPLQVTQQGVHEESIPSNKRKREPDEEIQETRNIENNDTEVFCICRKSTDDEIYVGCDNEACPNNGWLHLACLGLKREPTSKTWQCPDCRKQPAQKKSKATGRSLKRRKH